MLVLRTKYILNTLVRGEKKEGNLYVLQTLKLCSELSEPLVKLQNDDGGKNLSATSKTLNVVER